MDYRDDVLVLAGDLTDNIQLLEQCFLSLSTKFKRVLFVPGNHELWVTRDDISTSLEKFHTVTAVCDECGISSDVYESGALSIVPLYGWYDFSFGPPGRKLERAWNDFSACVWPQGYTAADVTDYFLQHNDDSRLDTANDTVISFSHFLPDIDLMPGYVNPAYHYIYPVLGSHLLGEQVNRLKPNMHVYGHSHVNNSVLHNDVQYINNAFGYPSETRITTKQLLCVYEQ